MSIVYGPQSELRIKILTQLTTYVLITLTLKKRFNFVATTVRVLKVNFKIKLALIGCAAHLILIFILTLGTCGQKSTCAL
jgi:hypothetical protein